MLTIGKRPLDRVLKSVWEKRHYVALKNMLLVYPSPFRNLRRYLSNSGIYPYQIDIRTPTGSIRPTLYSFHDLQTVNEIFCRLDYFADKTTKVVVDIGSNIGISALYFLTRNSSNKAFLFEPVVNNVKRLKQNLQGLEKRYQLQMVAVADFSGEANFFTETTGRYGCISEKQTEQTVPVSCLHINEILRDILSQENKIDILKIDIEGSELNVLDSIERQYLEKIDTIYIEAANQLLMTIQGFGATCAGDIQKYCNLNFAYTH